MTLKFDHVHLKAKDPDKTAAWYADACGFTVGERVVRPVGDVFIRCKTPDGALVVISGEKTGETLPKGSADLQLGLEHFAMTTDNFDADLARMVEKGATLFGEAQTAPNGIRYAFVQGPDDVRIEVMWFPKG